ncbi:hypothetical protein CJF32_00004175 [Rutstroemia sp. NJR-2017a WRK4]|nr:hypothetical protein CJF32_00004175 [Rutstroemia sp. NJR-2017a WRK4]
MTQAMLTASNESHSQTDELLSPDRNPSPGPEHSDEDHTITSPSQPQPQASPSPHAKPCSLCHTSRDVLIRCQIDESQKWHFVCTGKCWTRVSGGKVDGDAAHPRYRYGGMWKNKHEAVSAKIKGRAKVRNRKGGNEGKEKGERGEDAERGGSGEGGGDD